jgi:hypothetical protein
MIDDDTRTALLVDVHRLIDKACTEAIEGLDKQTELAYPPGGPGTTRLNTGEQQALSVLSVTQKTALRKVMADAIASAFFGFFTVLDGVGDPHEWKGSTWVGLDLDPAKGAAYRPMLHDEFYETYWLFYKKHAGAGKQ